jgi:hypothetical protein
MPPEAATRSGLAFRAQQPGSGHQVPPCLCLAPEHQGNGAFPDPRLVWSRTMIPRYGRHLLPAIPLTMKKSSLSAENYALREDLTSSVPSTLFFEKILFPECNIRRRNLLFLILFPGCNTGKEIGFFQKTLPRGCFI